MVTGPLQRIDSIIIKGDVEISISYLENYLNIRQGGLYDEHELSLIHKRLNDLHFLKEEKPWRLDFTINQNKLYLFLASKKSNQINGLIGLQPNTEANDQFQLTVDFLLSLQNSLGYGETIETTYKNLSYESPLFHAHVMAPYILGTHFGLEGNFDLYKQDSTFRKLTFKMGIRYQLTTDDYISLFYQNTGNRIITVDTQAIRINKKLPENIDVKS